MPNTVHASIIGRGGAGVAELTKKYNAKIVMPGRQEWATCGEPVNPEDIAGAAQQDIVKLVGSRTACEAAAKELKVRLRSRLRTARQHAHNAQSRGTSSSSQRPSKSISIPRHLHARVAEGGRLAKQARDLGVRIDHGGVKAPASSPMPPRPKRPATNGSASTSARIDMDGAHDDGADDDDLEIFVWDVVELGEESRPKDEAEVPWNLSGPSFEAVADIEAIINERLESARQATHAAYLQVAGSSMPRLVGRGGSGLERLRGSGATVDVVGKRDADTSALWATLNGR